VSARGKDTQPLDFAERLAARRPVDHVLELSRQFVAKGWSPPPEAEAGHGDPVEGLMDSAIAYASDNARALADVRYGEPSARREADATLEKAKKQRTAKLDVEARARLQTRVRALLDAKSPSERAEFMAGAGGAGGWLTQLSPSERSVVSAVLDEFASADELGVPAPEPVDDAEWDALTADDWPEGEADNAVDEEEYDDEADEEWSA